MKTSDNDLMVIKTGKTMESDIHQSMDKSLREVEHVLLYGQASHRICSLTAPLLACADILCFAHEDATL